MKKLILFVFLLVSFTLWVKDWVGSGRMDNFIHEHPHPSYTPKILFGISEAYFFFQHPKQASHYYRWIIQEYPAMPQIPKVRWKLARCYEELNNKGQALEQYIILKDSYTNTGLGLLASKRYDTIKY